MRVCIGADVQVESFEDLEDMLHALASLVGTGACCDGKPIAARGPNGIVLVHAYRDPAQVVPFPRSAAPSSTARGADTNTAPGARQGETP